MKFVLPLFLALVSPLSAHSFFAFGYGFRDLGPAEQAAYLHSAGFDGIAANVWNDKLRADFATLLQTPEVASGRLTVAGVYFPYSLTEAQHRRLVSETLQLCAPRQIPLWLAVKREAATEEGVVALIRGICDEAARLGIPVVLYPHDNHFMLTAEDSLRLIEMVQRPNLFTSLHLHQELRAGNAARLDEIVARAASRSVLCSVSGANLPSDIRRGSSDWSDVVQPLAGSAYDVESFYALLVKHGYRGPVGVQNYGIPGDPKRHHADSLALLRRWEAKYAPAAKAGAQPN